MSEKVFTDYDQQIELLVSRGLNVESFDYAVSVLKETGYYSLINGYQSPFLDPCDDNNYIDGASIEEIYHLYLFDHTLMAILFKYILRIENHFKSVLAHEFSRKYGHDNYLKLSNFCARNFKRDQPQIFRLISEIQSELSRNCLRNDSVRHYLTKHGYVPFWILVKNLSFGTANKFYMYLHDDVRSKISKAFYMKPEVIDTLLQNLSLFRNVCAHSNRLYCFKTNGPIPHIPIYNVLNIPKDKNGNYMYGSRDFLSLLLIICSFHPESAKQLVENVQEIVGFTRGHFSSIPFDSITSQIGLKAGWEEISQYTDYFNEHVKSSPRNTL